jgi:hypothetical protein
MSSKGEYEPSDGKNEIGNILPMRGSSAYKGHKMKKDLPLTIGKYFNGNVDKVIAEERYDLESSKEYCDGKVLNKGRKCKFMFCYCLASNYQIEDKIQAFQALQGGQGDITLPISNIISLNSTPYTYTNDSKISEFPNNYPKENKDTISLANAKTKNRNKNFKRVKRKKT